MSILCNRSCVNQVRPVKRSFRSGSISTLTFSFPAAHRVIDERHALSTKRWDLERRFVVLTDKDLLETEADQKQQHEEGPAPMNSLLDSLTTMCVCTAPRRPKFSDSQRRTKKRRVYPVEGFSQTPLNAKHVVKKRLSNLQTDHFFRPVSEDDMRSV